MPAMAEPRVSGVVVRDQLAVYEEMVGPAVVRAAREALPPTLGAELEHVLPIAWVRLSAYNALLAEIARRVGRDLLTLDAEAVRVGTERSFSTVWRVLLRVTTDHALVTRTPLFYSKGFDTGRLSARIPSPGQAEVELVDFPDISDVDLQGVRITIETVLRLAGRKDVRGTQQRTPQGGRFVVTFR